MSKETQNIISIINRENISDSTEETLLNYSLEFLKMEKISMKNLLDKIFINIYSFYWRRISNDYSLISMNLSYQGNQTELININDETEKLEELKKIVI